MKYAEFVKAGEIKIVNKPMPKIEKDDDVIIKVLRTCVCGSDLWAYRGLEEQGHENSGHEIIGVIEEVGKEITTVEKGDFVIAPFTHGCGHCRACLAGFDGVCMNRSSGDNFSGGYQAEYVRYQHAQWSLVNIPGKPIDYSEGMLKSFLALADVMATGYHAARVANVQPGDSVIVLGDGAIGLSAILQLNCAELNKLFQLVVTQIVKL